MFAFFFAETEDDDGVVILQHDHFDDFVDIGGGCLLALRLCERGNTIIALRCAAFPSLAFLPFCPEYCAGTLTLAIFKHSHCFLEILFSEFSTVINDQKDPIPASRKEIVLQWRGSEVSIHNMTRLGVDLGDPLSELQCVGDSCGKEDVVDFIGEENDCFFPDYSSFLISHVMDLVKNYPRDFAHDFRSSIQHASENLPLDMWSEMCYFCCHYNTTCSGIDGDISSH